MVPLGLGVHVLRDKTTRLVFLAFFLSSIIILKIGLHHFGRYAAVTRITTSDRDDAPEVHSFRNVMDRSTTETFTLDNYWIPVSTVPAWIELELGREYEVDEVRLLNTRKGLRKIRKGLKKGRESPEGYRVVADDSWHTRDYRLTLTDSGGETAVITNELPGYSTWQRHVFEPRRPKAVSVRIDILSSGPKGAGLNEVAVLGVPSRGSARLAREAGALLGSALAAFLLTAGWRRAPRSFTGARVFLVLAMLAIAGLGVHVLRYSTSVSALEWNLQYRVTELDSWSSIVEFFQNLMIPIPLPLAILEIAANKALGGIDLSIRTLYKCSFVVPYLVVMVLAYPSIPRMIISFLLSVVLLWGSAIVHPGNPQLYDTVLPMFVMLFAFFLYVVAETVPRGALGKVALLLAGFFLAMATLTRPYVIALLFPMVAIVAFQMRGRFPRRAFLWFLTPIALFAVSWHVHLAVNHGQLTMTNHAGFNMIHAWPMVEKPRLLPEEVRPPYRGMNNPTHIVNSSRLQKAVLRHVLDNPVESLVHVGKRVAAVMQGKTVILRWRLVPQHVILSPYRLAVRVTSILLMVSFLAILVEVGRRAVTSRQTLPGLLRSPQLILVFFAFSSLMIMSIGDRGEEARFVISILPVLASIPGWDFAAQLHRLADRSSPPDPPSPPARYST